MGEAGSAARVDIVTEKEPDGIENRLTEIEVSKIDSSFQAIDRLLWLPLCGHLPEQLKCC